MKFMIFFNSLGELLYEVMSWLVFYPLTLWRAVVHPWSMMRYADAELADTAEQRFADVLSPPMFLLITVLIGHGVELAVIGADPILKSTKGLAALITDDSNLIGLRMIAFATFPLMSSVRLVRRKGQKLDRNSLKLPFYSQCYATAPMALRTHLRATGHLGCSTVLWLCSSSASSGFLLSRRVGFAPNSGSRGSGRSATPCAPIWCRR